MKKETKTKKVIEKKEKEVKPKVTLVEFTLSAVIPTVQYGNIQPSITVKADSIESAIERVSPLIESMYDKYSEQVPRFLKPEIKMKEKVVPPEIIVETVKVEPTLVDPKPNIAVPDTASPAAHPVNATDVPFDESTRQEAYLKAENVIKSAQTDEALNLIQEKIMSSTKIHNEDKPKLIEAIIGRRKLITF